MKLWIIEDAATIMAVAYPNFMAKRCVLLGNDETHYVRKWLEKDVTSPKQLIDLTVRWIENEVETKRILEDMPE
jgi:hypothetical protein